MSVACGAPQQARRISPPARAEASEPAPVDFMPFMESVAADPRRVLERVDSARGLVIARWLDCETENPIKTLRHACGESIAPALEELLTGMREAIELAKAQPDDDPWVRCQGGAQPECVVPPDGECWPKYTLVFAAERSDAPLVAILERNDWQFPPESNAEVDQRVKELMARSASGCSPR